MSVDWKKLTIHKTITLSESGPSFTVFTTMEQDRRSPRTDAFITELNFNPGGNVEDWHIVYQDGKGKIHSKPAGHPWEVLSTDWGPTKMLAT